MGRMLPWLGLRWLQAESGISAKILNLSRADSPPGSHVLHPCPVPVAPQAPAETRTCFQNHWEPPDTQQKRLTTFPPWFKSFCLNSLIKNLSYHWVLYELITFMYKQEEKKFFKQCRDWYDNCIRFWWVPAWPVNRNSKKSLCVLSWYLILCASAAGGERELEWVYSKETKISLLFKNASYQAESIILSIFFSFYSSPLQLPWLLHQVSVLPGQMSLLGFGNSSACSTCLFFTFRITNPSLKEPLICAGKVELGMSQRATPSCLTDSWI